MLNMRERIAAASGLKFSHESTTRTKSFPCDVPSERKIERVGLDGFQLLRATIVGYTDDWDLDMETAALVGARCACMTVHTFVFLISAFKAPTPPRSPADIPSTSSMIRHVLSVMVTPSAFVA